MPVYINGVTLSDYTKSKVSYVKHIVCYSGGHSSALVAIEVVRRFGNKNVILLNHDINPSVESPDIKRFKLEVAEYLGIPITYANHPEWDKKDPLDIVMDLGGFKFGNGQILCTYNLKTKPFHNYLDTNFPNKNCVLYYGFDANEKVRIQRRIGVLSNMGYKSDYPLALWSTRTINDTQEVGIARPNTYSVFKHGNCTGCLKAGKQHWYIVYLTRKDLWDKALFAEYTIGHSLLKDTYLEDLEPLFAKMKCAGITTTEHELGVSFFSRVRKDFPQVYEDQDEKPCECVF